MTSESVLKISEAEPSPILHDFAVYTWFLTQNRLPLTPKNQFHAKSALYQLNQQMKTYVTADNPNYRTNDLCSTLA